jgi:hypothetical protein
VHVNETWQPDSPTISFAVGPFGCRIEKKGIPMSFRFPVKLYAGSVRQGQVTFHSLFIKEPSDYTCEPEGILAQDEAKDLFRQIRRAPLTDEGRIGNLVWRV